MRNGFVHDARVLRAARTLVELGYRPVVVASLTAPDQELAEVVDGVAIVRVRPGAAMRWIERRFRRSAPAAARRQGADGGPGGGATATSIALRAFRWVRTMDYYWRASRVVLGHRPALVHCNDHNTMWIGAAAKLVGRSRVLYDAHELWPDRNGRWEWRPWLLVTEAFFTRIADAVVVASPGFVEPMTRRYRIPAPKVVRNVPARQASSAAARVAGPDQVAVYVGALLLGRGLEEAIDAVALLPDVRLRVIGHGATPGAVAALTGRARALGIEERFEVLPPVSPDRVVAALAGASVGLSLFQPICRSHELTLPNKIFEYVAALVPVLTSDMPVSAEFVRRHGIGEVVAAGDPAAIARGLALLLEPNRATAIRPQLERTARANTWELERGSLIAAYEAAIA